MKKIGKLKSQIKIRDGYFMSILDKSDLAKVLGGILSCSGDNTTLKCGDKLTTNPDDYKCSDGASLEKIINTDGITEYIDSSLSQID